MATEELRLEDIKVRLLDWPKDRVAVVLLPKLDPEAVNIVKDHLRRWFEEVGVRALVIPYGMAFGLMEPWGTSPVELPPPSEHNAPR